MRNSVLAITILIAGALGSASAWDGVQAVAVQSEPKVSPARERALARVKEHMRSQDEALAKADAAQAVQEGEFGLISSGDDRWPSAPPVAAICFTPDGGVPDELYYYGHGDFITPEVSAPFKYFRAYNRFIVEHADFPHADICRLRGESEVADQGLAVTRPARDVARPPRDLFEAARRGTAADVRKFLDAASVDAMDGLQMTALSWAVARNNRPAIELLLAARANPWIGGAEDWTRHGWRSAIFWSAALGREDDFKRFVKLPGRPSDEDGWPSTFMSAAMSGGSKAILRHMLAEPNAGVRLEFLNRPLPSAELFAIVLKRQPDLATPLLFRAANSLHGRPDLVRVALDAGADPNAVESYETPLTEASSAIAEKSVEIVDMLLKAGADPNFEPHRTRGPVYVAVRMLKLDGEEAAIDERARTIFHKLIAAGGDPNQLDYQGRPPIWFLLFPYSFSHEELDASFVTPKLLKMLVDSGMDINAVWNGKRVLPLVEAQDGKDSDLARTLRELGAKP